MSGRSGDDVADDGPEMRDSPADAEASAEDSDGEGVFGPFEDAGPIEPGDPSLVNALFVLLGVLAGVVATLQLLGIV